MEHLNELASTIIGDHNANANESNPLINVVDPSKTLVSHTSSSSTTTEHTVPSIAAIPTSTTPVKQENDTNISTIVPVPMPNTDSSIGVDTSIAVNSSVLPIMIGTTLSSSSHDVHTTTTPHPVPHDPSTTSAPAPAPPPTNLYEDTDQEWISLYGPSVFQNAVLQGQWRIYKHLETGALYYVDTMNNNFHTWDCPPEVATDMKRKALEATLDEYAYEGLGADFETNGPWVPPSPTKAVLYRTNHVFGGGRTSCCCFHDNDFAQLGVGVALYFRTLKALIGIFLMLTILSLPAWAFYTWGYRITGSVPDPMKFTRVSLGNIGPLSYDYITEILNTREQIAKLTKTTNTSSTSSSISNISSLSITSSATYSDSELLNIPYFSLDKYAVEMDGLSVAYTITAFDLGAMLLLLIAVAVLRGESEKFIAYAERKNVSAADYTIFVRGLPSDVTVEELRDHFSTLFALDGTGADMHGKWDSHKHAVELLMQAKTHRHIHKSKSWLFGSKSNRIVPTSSIDLPKTLPNSSITNVNGEHPSPTNASSSSTTVEQHPHSTAEPDSPVPHSPEPHVHTYTHDDLSSPHQQSQYRDQFEIPTNPKALKTAALAARRAIDTRRRRGIITDADVENHFTSRIEVMGKGIVTDISHNNDATFAGSWIADISIVRPVNKLLSAYLSAQELASKLREARARVKMWSPGTPHPLGPNPEKRNMAMKQVDKLGSELASLRESLKSKDLSTSSVESTCVGSAFVTFNCEESLQRCLKAYQGSTSSILRPFQSAHLRLRCPMAPGFHGLPGQEVVTDEKGNIEWKTWHRDLRSNYGRGYTLIVTKAPDPSDVIHENLAITSTSRCLRQCCTGIITLLLVIIGLIMMIIAQSYSKLLTTSTPDLSLCSTELPALYFGGYDNVTDANLALDAGYGQPSNLQASLTIQGRRRRLQQLRSLWSTTNENIQINNNPPYNPTISSSSFHAVKDITTSSSPVYSPRQSRQLSTDNTNPSASSIMLTRLANSIDRAVEDDLCPDGSITLAYRYNFSDIPINIRSDYSSLSYTDYSNINNNNLFNLGSTIPYSSSSHVSTVCDLSQAQSIITTIDPTLTPRNLLDVSCPDPRLLQANEGYCPCIPKSSQRKCLTLPCFRPELVDETHTCREFTASTIVGCYCVDTLNAYIESLGAVKGFIAYTEREGDICETFITSYIQAQSLIVISAAAASVINILLGLIIPALTAMEGHDSLSARSRALAVKVAAAQTINTGLTALLVNARLPKGAVRSLPSIIQAVGLLNGEFDDFNTHWYGVVGTTICTTALINTLIPPLLMSLEYILDSCRRRAALRHPGTVVTQAAMDELYVGATFETPRRYPLIITMISVSLVYSTGFPLLLPLACFGFILQYSVDKLMILRFYRKPPAYDASMTRLLLGIIPYAVLIHCGFAIWMLSSPATLPSAMLTPELILKLLANFGVSTESFTSNTAELQAAAAASGLSQEEIANAIASSFFTKYTALVGDYDAIGILPRILRLNVFPYFLFLFIVFIILTLSNVIYTIYSLIMIFLRGITCGFICCSGRGCCNHGEGFDLNTIRKQTIKSLSNIIHQHMDKPHFLIAIQYLTEFKAHAQAYASFNRVRAGLLFEALFVRTIKQTELEDHELLEQEIIQRKMEILQQKAKEEAKLRSELMTQTEANQATNPTPLDGTTTDTVSNNPNPDSTVPTNNPAPIILLPTSTQTPEELQAKEEAENAQIIKEVTEKHNLHNLHKGPPLLLDGETTAIGKGLSPFTQEFSRIHDIKAAGTALTYPEIDAGWRLQEVDARTLDDRHGQTAAFNRTILTAALEQNVAPKGTKEFLEDNHTDSSTFLSSGQLSSRNIIMKTINNLTTITSPVLDTLRTKSHRYRTNRRLVLPPAILRQVEAAEASNGKNNYKTPQKINSPMKNNSPSKQSEAGNNDQLPHSLHPHQTLEMIPDNTTTDATNLSHLSTPVKNSTEHKDVHSAGSIHDDDDHVLTPHSPDYVSTPNVHITDLKTEGMIISAMNTNQSFVVRSKAKATRLFLESIFYLRKLHTPDENNTNNNSSTNSDVTSTSRKNIYNNAPGTAKRTWEVIKDAGLYSYDVRKNSRYTNAFAIAKAGEMEDEEDERLEQLRLKQQMETDVHNDPNKLAYQQSIARHTYENSHIDHQQHNNHHGKWANDSMPHSSGVPMDNSIEDDGEAGLAADV